MLSTLVRENFKLTPKGIIEELDLRRPIYQKTAAFGHFGRKDAGFTWEKTDKAAALKAAATAQRSSPRSARVAIASGSHPRGGPLHGAASCVTYGPLATDAR